MINILPNNIRYIPPMKMSERIGICEIACPLICGLILIFSEIKFEVKR